MMRVATRAAAFVTGGGRSGWFVGGLLLVYAIFALALNLLPPRLP